MTEFSFRSFKKLAVLRFSSPFLLYSRFCLRFSISLCGIKFVWILNICWRVWCRTLGKCLHHTGLSCLWFPEAALLSLASRLSFHCEAGDCRGNVDGQWVTAFAMGTLSLGNTGSLWAQQTSGFAVLPQWGFWPMGERQPWACYK